MSTPHEVLNPSSLAPAVGFAHAVRAAPGRTVYLAGEAAHDGDGVIVSDAITDQFERAARNVVEALSAAGADPSHLVSLQIFVTDVGEYRAALERLGAIYRRHFGRHYPASALLEVSALFDPAAKVELVGVAVVPD